MNTEPLTRRLGLLVALSTAVAIAAIGCSGTSTTASPPITAAPATATPAATQAGPATYADWVTRQGFGGSSGLRNVHKLAVWLTENESAVTTWDLTSDQNDIKVLLRWLDDHPPTICWARNHDVVRASLATLVSEYDRAIAARTDGPSVPDDIAQAILAAAQAAFDEPVPTDCP